MYELIETDDGSLTSRDVGSGELYHNRAGAYTEALLNYVLPSATTARLGASRHLRILDVCFGLGYNTFVLLEQCLGAGLSGKIEVTAVESDMRILELLPQVLQDKRLGKLADCLHLAGANLLSRESIQFTNNNLTVCLHVHLADLRTLMPILGDDIDLIFHDPFSAKHVPELWTVEIFRHYHRLLVQKDGAVLTYSAATAVRGGLKQAGFNIFRTVAVGNKTGGTFAGISIPASLPDHVFPLTDIEVERLASRSALPYSDPTMTGSRVDVGRRRQQALDNHDG